MRQYPVFKKQSHYIIPHAFFALFLIALFLSCASTDVAKAEEYYSLGMAYFELGKYTEAEQWLNRARTMDKTMTASEYNLGRIAFATGRYEEAAMHFENILSRDPDNVMALRSAAYSRIRNGDLQRAEAHYDRVLVLVPESADEGYNYALVLYGLKKYEQSEEVLNRYPYSLEENLPSVLLLARAQKQQDKVEAIDTYAKWLGMTTPTSQVLFEYALALEDAGLYARALEQYNEALDVHTQDTETLKKTRIRFEKARLLLIADPENDTAITELSTAVSEGFEDTIALDALVRDERISSAHREEIRGIINEILTKTSESESSQQDQ